MLPAINKLSLGETQKNSPKHLEFLYLCGTYWQAGTSWKEQCLCASCCAICADRWEGGLGHPRDESGQQIHIFKRNVSTGSAECDAAPHACVVHQAVARAGAGTQAANVSLPSHN